MLNYYFMIIWSNIGIAFKNIFVERQHPNSQRMFIYLTITPREDDSCALIIL